jgi:hypothetical protein
MNHQYYNYLHTEFITESVVFISSSTVNIAGKKDSIIF